MGEVNNVVSAYKLYKHSQQFCSNQSIGKTKKSKALDDTP